MSQHFDVLVVGGGVVGLTAALAMAARNYTVAVVDGGPLNIETPTIDLRVYAINKASQRLLIQLDVWQRLDSSRVAPYEKMYVWDAVNGAHIDFDSRLVAEPNLGSIIEESVLKQALLQQVIANSNISLFPFSSVDGVAFLDKNVRISSQAAIWEGSLLMIADGANSPMRKQLKIALSSWSYNQHALVATVNTEKPHLKTAYQVFNSDGPLAFLPLSNPNKCSIVWSTAPERAQKLLTISEEEFNKAISISFARHLGDVRLESTRHQFPLQMRHVRQYVGSNWLLLGDAAHTIHPLAGLGLNVGLADVASWVRCLDNSKTKAFSKKTLGAYQRERKHAVWQTIALMEGFKHLFGSSFFPITTLRGMGLRLCNGVTPLKRLFIEHAAG